MKDQYCGGRQSYFCSHFFYTQKSGRRCHGVHGTFLYTTNGRVRIALQYIVSVVHHRDPRWAGPRTTTRGRAAVRVAGETTAMMAIKLDDVAGRLGRESPVSLCGTRTPGVSAKSMAATLLGSLPSDRVNHGYTSIQSRSGSSNFLG